MDKIAKLTENLKDMQSLKTDLASSSGTSSDLIFFGLSMTGIFFGFLFSMLGFAYFRIGKRNQNFKRMILGVLLMIYPYFVTNTIYIILIGLFLSLLPVFLKNYFSI